MGLLVAECLKVMGSGTWKHESDWNQGVMGSTWMSSTYGSYSRTPATCLYISLVPRLLADCVRETFLINSFSALVTQPLLLLLKPRTVTRTDR